MTGEGASAKCEGRSAKCEGASARYEGRSAKGEGASAKGQKLELTWVGKDRKIAVEPRILLEDREKSNLVGLAPRASRGGRGATALPDNLLIHGDNLLALKALEQKYGGQVKCVYIDPPYNTGSAFEHYDDNLEHSQWLNLMRPRLEILWNLLAPDGSIWISIDDREGAYLKVLCDELYGRRNFIADVAWEKSDSPRMDAKLFSTRYDHTLVYARNIDEVKINQVKVDEIPEHYDKTDADGRRYYLKPLRAMGMQDSREDRPSLYFPISAPDGSEVYPKRADGSDGRWRWSKERIVKDSALIAWTNSKKGWSPYYKIYADSNATRPPETLWSFSFAGSNRNAKSEQVALFGTEKAFDTPKPEKLILRILEVASNPGDLVLDSFLGSGTTCAVAHKMGRRWIGVEMGEHAYTHCKVRLDKVIAGADGGGVTKETSWTKGGGYRFYELAPSLVKFDAFGEAVINAQYNADMLAAGMALQEGFVYEPDERIYWKQAHAKGSSTSWLYTTTRHVGREYLSAIASGLGDGEFLEIACTSFDAKAAKDYPRITMRKIPESILKRCEFDRDSYALNIVNDEREDGAE